MKIPVLLLCGLMSLALGKSKIEPKVFEELQVHPTMTVFISFKKSNTTGIRENFASIKHTLSTRASKLNTLYQLLKDHADDTQQTVQSFLEGKSLEKTLKVFQSWMTNELIVYGIDKETILALEEMEDVKEIRADRLTSKPIGSVQLEDTKTRLRSWGVWAILAPQVWAMGNRGQGVVVGSIDTGVRGTHEALRGNHRYVNGWFDPINYDVFPTDYNGHGTHTLGTIVGQVHDIGVAPLSNWIACKGCDEGCSDSHLIACGNFMGCPTDVNGQNPQCHLAPHLVSNSWGGPPGRTFYDDVISTWILMGIAPIFSAGNEGRHGCETALYPGDHPAVITVGSIDSNSRVSGFSSLGPTLDGRIKPDVSAPGSNIFSSFHTGDNVYEFMQGTSMACPHVSGIAALLYTKNPELPYDEIKEAIITGAGPVIPSGKTCGGIPDNIYPNNHVGAGCANALFSYLNV